MSRDHSDEPASVATSTTPTRTHAIGPEPRHPVRDVATQDKTADRRAVEWQVARWVSWYNHQRLHFSIGNVPPVEFEHTHRQAKTVTPIPEVA